MLPSGSLIGLNPYELPGVRRIAAWCGIELSDKPNETEIQQLFTSLGKGKLYGANAEELEFDDHIYGTIEVLDAMQALLEPVPLRTVHAVEAPWGPAVEIAIGGTANWMERRAKERVRQTGSGLTVSVIYLLGSDRLMEDKAGTPHPTIREFEDEYGGLPAEHQLLARIHRNFTGIWQNDVIIGVDLDDNVLDLAKSYPEIKNFSLYMALNAGAVDKAFQVRGQLRKVFPDFDNDPKNPQFFFSSDGFTLARTPEEAADPANFQRPKTFLSYIPRLVNQLYQLDS